MGQRKGFLASAFLAGSLGLAGLAPVGAQGPDGAFDGAPGGDADLPPFQTPPAVGDSIELEGRLWVTVAAKDREGRSRVAEAGVSIEEVLQDRVSGFASPSSLRRLRRLGLDILSSSDIGTAFGPEAFPPQDRAYHDYAEVLSELESIASARPFCSIVTAGTSLEGKTIRVLRFNTTTRGAEQSSKPGILFMGTHHAREHLSTEVPLLIARWLADNSDKPEVRKLIDTRDIYFMPLVNPDGSEMDTVGGRYHMHRKNARPNGTDNPGVDLNRNYGFHWGEGGASKDPSDDTYRGPRAFSEPETQAVRRFVEGRPNLKILLSYHTFSELILYPWGHTYDPITDGRALKAYEAMAQAMAAMTGYKPEQSSELYIASGDTTDWSWGEKNIFSFTFELTPRTMRQGGFYPGAGVIQDTVRKNIGPALYLIELADDPIRAAGGSSARLAPLPAPFEFDSGS